MAKIIGNPTVTPMAIPDWNQTNPLKADYIKNKPDCDGLVTLGIGLKTICGGWWFNTADTAGGQCMPPQGDGRGQNSSIISPIKIIRYPAVVEVDDGFCMGASKFDKNGRFIGGISASKRTKIEITDEQCKYLGIYIQRKDYSNLNGIPITADECGLRVVNATPAPLSADISNILYDVEWGFGYINRGYADLPISPSKYCIYSNFIDVSSFKAFNISCTDDFMFRVFLFDKNKALISSYLGHPETSMLTGGIIKYIRINLEVKSNSPLHITGVQMPLSHRYHFKLNSFVYLDDNIRNDVEMQYAEDLKIALAAQRNLSSNLSQNDSDVRLPTFVHVTDIHGDSTCFENACKIAKYLKATSVVNTGDTVFYYSADGTSFVEGSVKSIGVNYLVTLGNHDTFQYNEAQAYEKHIAPFVESNNYIIDANVESPTYYYKDFADKKLRILSVNQFQYSGASTDTNMHFTQEQIDFIVASLSSTPANYGVVIIMHTPEKRPVKSAEYSKFFEDASGWFSTGSNNSPITEIVDAFISGTTINKTYSNKSGTTPETFTVNADFSNKNSGVEFICYITGHLHRDFVYYLTNTTNKQLMLNETCTCSLSNKNKDGSIGDGNPYLTELSNLPRVDASSTKDAFNVYCIDRDNKTVKIVRIGSNMPCDLSQKRDYMVIPYTD